MGAAASRSRQPPRRTSTPRRQSGWLWLTFLCLLVAAVDANAVRNPFVMDDLRDTIVENANLRHLASRADWSAVLRTPGPETPVTGRPLVSLSFALNYASGGLDPVGYHLTNLVIHLLAVLLVFGIVRRAAVRVIAVRSDALVVSAAPFAFACAALWGVHPLHTEVVDYVTQRTESMMAVFYLLTLYCAIRDWTAAAIAACALGMLCKESMVTAPLMVLLYDAVFCAHSVPRAVRQRPGLYAGLAATWLVLAAILLAHPVIRSRGGASGVTPWSYFLNQPPLIVRYLRLVVWPDALILDYGLPRAVSLREAAPAAALLALLVVLVVWAWRRTPTLAFLGTWFFVTLAPGSSFAPIATEVGAERRMYVPLVALVVLVAIAIERIVRRVTRFSSESARPMFAIVVLVVGVALSVRSVTRNAEYADPLRLWQTTEASYPHARLHYTVGVELAKQGRAADALPKFQAASPDYPKADFALGLTFASLGRHEEALRALDAFLTRVPDDVDVPAAYAAIGRSAAALDQPQVAEGAFRTALRLVPSTDAARIGLADLLRRASRYDEAIVEYRAYLVRVPDDPNAQSNLGIALIAKGDSAAAVEAFAAAVRLAPGDAEKHENLGHALASSGRMAEAVASYRTALALAPNRPEFRSALGSALVVHGNVEEGLAEIRRALAADPNNPAVRSDAQLAADWVQAHRVSR